MFLKIARASLQIALCALLLASVPAAGEAPSGYGVSVANRVPADVFSRAQARGEFIVGVPFLAPTPAPGAKIRSPERLDAVMAQHLARQLNLPVKLLQVNPSDRDTALATGAVDLLIADRVVADDASNASPQRNAETPGVTAIAIGYRARPKAIIRSDTSLRHWAHVKDLTVCMSTAAFAAQALARQSGARVQTYPVPSDALVAVREGGCDVGVIDDATWAPLMKFPEWKKFSATLTASGPRTERVWLAPDDRATVAWLDAAMQQWRRDKVVESMIDQWATDVAFDVYLDQEVPDCHGG